MTDKPENEVTNETLDLLEKEGTEFLSSTDAYMVLKQLAESEGQEFPASYSSYLLVLKELGLGVEDPTKLKNFVNDPATGAAIIKGVELADGFFKKNFNFDAAQFARDGASKVGQRISEVLKNTVKQQAENTGFKETFQKFGDFTNTGGGDGNTTKADYEYGSSWNPTGMSLKNKPMEAEFSTDIQFIGADKYYLDGKEENTPLLMKCGLPGLIDFAGHTPSDNTEDPFLEDYYHTITAEYRKAIAQRVTYSDKVNSLFTNETITKKLNKDLQCCCTYYFWMSVLAYTDDPRNKNKAMNDLRKSLTPTDMQKLEILQRAIQQSVIPPFIHKWSFYIMGNYKQSYMPGAPLLKILPWFMDTAPNGGVFPNTNVMKFMGQAAITSTTVPPGPTVYKGPIDCAILLMQQDKPLENVLGAAFPDWCNIELFGYSSLPRFSNDYLDFWCNGMYKASHSHAGGYFTEIELPKSPSEEIGITYANSTDAPDGWTQAMQAMEYMTAATGTSRRGPGLFKPYVVTPKHLNSDQDYDGQRIAAATSTYQTQSNIHPPQPLGCSCLIYDGEFGAEPGFFDVCSKQVFQSISRNTYSTTHASQSYSHHQKFGTSIMKLQLVDVIRPSIMKWLDLYAEDVRQAPPTKNNDKNSSKSRGKKNYSKGKFNKDKMDDEES